MFAENKEFKGKSGTVTVSFIIHFATISPRNNDNAPSFHNRMSYDLFSFKQNVMGKKNQVLG